MTLPEATNLIPEYHLIADLSPQWRQRFEKAYVYMRDNLADSPSWDDVSEHCAVSPYHFHRMFTAVYGETPGQYLARLRLRNAVRLLFNDSDISVIEVAVECGFSSSQALAKSLKKELALTAKKIRALSQEKDEEAIEAFLSLLGTPVEQGNADYLEKQMADSLQFEQVAFPERMLTTSLVQPLTAMNIWKSWNRQKKHTNQNILLVTPLGHLNYTFDEQHVFMGYEVAGEVEADTCLPARNFLCCRVKVDSETAYIMAWNALYSHVMEQGVELDNDGYAVEIIHNPEGSQFFEATDMTLSIPLML